MSLKINVKAGERILINGSVVVNAGRDTSLVFETSTRFLLEKDVMALKDANTPAARIYFVLQMLYIFPELDENRLKMFEQLVTEFVAAAPSSISIVKKIIDHAEKKEFFKSLKYCRQLMDFEKERIGDGPEQNSGL